MAQFTNQARLSYLDNVTVSNVAVGQLLNAITVTKTPVSDTYSLNDSITYVINIINTGTASYSNLTVTDDLGAYEYNGSTLVPLDYVDGSIKYFINGVLQPAPTVASVSPLAVSGISVPVGGNTAIVYEATTNQFAPLNEGGQITVPAASYTQGSGGEYLVTPGESVLVITGTI